MPSAAALAPVVSCVISVAGSSAALVKRVLENSAFQKGSLWFRRSAGVLIGLLGVYFTLRPFVGT